MDGPVNSKAANQRADAEAEAASSSAPGRRQQGEPPALDILTAFAATCPGFYDATSDTCCLVRAYDCRDGDDSDDGGGGVRLNDMVEIVGIYTADPFLTSPAADDDDDLDAAGAGGDGAALLATMADPYYGFSADDARMLGQDDDTDDCGGGGGGNGGGDGNGGVTGALPPPSVAPRLHCIVFRRLGASFPLLVSVSMPVTMTMTMTASSSSRGSAEPLLVAASPWAASAVSAAAAATRSEGAAGAGGGPAVYGWVVRRVARALGGDALAAEYVALALLSRIRSREQHESLLLGVLSLSLSGLLPGDPRLAALRAVVADVVPRCVAIEADGPSLDAVAMYPVRDDAKNRLTLSPLQLGTGTVVLVNETGLAEGRLGPQAARSAAALRCVATTQNLPVAFPYCDVKIPTDYPLIFATATQAGNSIFSPSDAVKVILQPPVDGVSAHDDDGGEGDTAAQLALARLWWARARHCSDVAMSDATARHAEDDFVHARQADARLSPADFHRWLTVARLLAAATGDGEICVAHWERMRALERARLDRVEKPRGPAFVAIPAALGGVGALRDSPQSVTMTSS